MISYDVGRHIYSIKMKECLLFSDVQSIYRFFNVKIPKDYAKSFDSNIKIGEFLARCEQMKIKNAFGIPSTSSKKQKRVKKPIQVNKTLLIPFRHTKNVS